MTPTFDAGAIILAGGKSRRMGADKSLLDYQGQPLIQHIARQLQPHFAEVMIISNDLDRYRFLGLEICPDLLPEQGPLMGIASGLRHSRHPWNFIMATDIPTVPVALLHKLFALTPNHCCVIPQEQDGRCQPLFGLYHRDLADEILSILEAGQRSVMALLDHCEPALAPIDTGLLANLNTPEDVEFHLGP